MTKIPSLHSINRAWLHDGPLSPHVPAYISRLKRGRYAATTAGRQLTGSLYGSAPWSEITAITRLLSRVDDWLFRIGASRLKPSPSDRHVWWNSRQVAHRRICLCAAADSPPAESRALEILSL